MMAHYEYLSVDPFMCSLRHLVYNHQTPTRECVSLFPLLVLLLFLCFFEIKHKSHVRNWLFFGQILRSKFAQRCCKGGSRSETDSRCHHMVALFNNLMMWRALQAIPHYKGSTTSPPEKQGDRQARCH